MYSDAIAPRGAQANRPPYTAVLCTLFVFALIVRIGVPSPVVDLIVNYTPEEGSIVEKIHPGTYAIAAVFVLTLLTMQASLDAWSYRAVRALLGFGAVIAVLLIYLAMTGRVGSAGYLIDTYVCAILGALTVLMLPQSVRIFASNALLATIVVSASLAAVEFLTRTPILPNPVEEAAFRATGLAGYPLGLGLTASGTILFVALSAWPAAVRALAILVLFIGVAAANARIALLAASLAVVVTTLVSAVPASSSIQRLRLRTLALVGGTILLATGLVVLAFSGFLDRFLARGLVDASSVSRIDAFKLFAFAGWNDILFGADIIQIAEIAEIQLGLLVIESSPVILVFQFGLLGAALFAIGLFTVVRRLLAGAPFAAGVATVLFFAVALSNNTLTTKTPVVLMLFVLLIGVQARFARRTGGER